ncbi:MAG: peptide-methionine (R)-S-oxide reductase MsrB [Pelagibacterales bacterium]|nr:peptide-methionine (R)-S-oxide reductase MsrB [Pelagibacterales bacterium]
MSKKTTEEWKKILNDEEYRVLIEKGTEYPHTGKYNMHFENGVYNCNGCNTPLFNSDQKFKSDCGWPSFDESIEGAIKYVDDYSLSRYRVEIICANCKGHLGHIFDDGPTETGKRYCVNSVSIDFKKKS